MSVVLWSVLVVVLLPVLVLVALAVRFTYDDWTKRRAKRRETAKAEKLGELTTRRLLGLDGEGQHRPEGFEQGRTA